MNTILAAATICILAFGCGYQSQEVAVDPELLARHRERLVLAEEPSDAIGVVALREQLESDEETEVGESEGAEEKHPEPRDDSMEVVVVGRIGGATPPEGALSDFPWEKGKAAFFIVDPAFEPDDHDHGEGHECKFCQEKTANAQAVVQFVGEDGQPLPIDARQLFDLEAEELVVVKGKAAVKVGTLFVTADGIYVRR